MFLRPFGLRNTHKYEENNIVYKVLVGKSEAKKPFGTSRIMINKHQRHMLSCYGLASLEILRLAESYVMQISNYVPMFRMTCILRLEDCKIILQVLSNVRFIYQNKRCHILPRHTFAATYVRASYLT